MADSERSGPYTVDDLIAALEPHRGKRVVMEADSGYAIPEVDLSSDESTVIICPEDE